MLSQAAMQRCSNADSQETLGLMEAGLRKAGMGRERAEGGGRSLSKQTRTGDHTTLAGLIMAQQGGHALSLCVCVSLSLSLIVLRAVYAFPRLEFILTLNLFNLTLSSRLYSLPF